MKRREVSPTASNLECDSQDESKKGGYCGWDGASKGVMCPARGSLTENSARSFNGFRCENFLCLARKTPCALNNKQDRT